MTFIDDLKALAAQLDQIPCVNYGGCGFVASRAAAAFMTLSPLVSDVKLVVLDSGLPHRSKERKDINIIRTRVTRPDEVWDWNQNGLYFGHVVVKFTHNGTSWYFDSEGVTKTLVRWANQGMYAYKGHLEVEEFLPLLKQKGSWNPTFNRRHCGTITKRVNKALAPYLELTHSTI